MASSDRLRRYAIVGGFFFAALSGAVAFAGYSTRDDGTAIRIGAPADTLAINPLDTATEVPTETVPTTQAATTIPATTATSTPDVTAGTDETTIPPLAAEPSTTLATTTTTSVPPTPSTEAPVTDPSKTCPKLDGSSARVPSFATAPPVCIDPNATYSAVITTSKGAITVSLDQKRAPKAVNNFVFLARYKFYDGLTIHRVIPGFVIQGGDPLGNGEGGPGYEFADELPSVPGYPIGSVAMANAGPNTNGSQFFIVSGDLGLQLPAQFTLFGKVATGRDVVKAIESVGRAPGPDGAEFPPSEIVTITSVKIVATNERAARIPGITTS